VAGRQVEIKYIRGSVRWAAMSMRLDWMWLETERPTHLHSANIGQLKRSQIFPPFALPFTINTADSLCLPRSNPHLLDDRGKKLERANLERVDPDLVAEFENDIVRGGWARGEHVAVFGFVKEGRGGFGEWGGEAKNDGKRKEDVSVWGSERKEGKDGRKEERNVLDSGWAI
jgi:hypothetical protein